MAFQSWFWRKKKLVGLGLITVAIGAVEGYVSRRYYDAREADTYDAAHLRLQQVADERAHRIEPWVAGMAGDAQVAGAYPVAAEVVTRSARASPADAAATPAGKHLADLLGTFIRLQGYRSACVCDSAGRRVLCAGQPIAEPVLADVRGRWLSAGGPAVDFFLSGGASVVVTATAIPPDAIAGRAGGFLLLAVEPSSSLYPQLQRGVAPYATAETFLVREGVLLSPTREVVRPLPTHGYPRIRFGSSSVRGVLFDHRGKTVIAASQKVEGTPWVIVAKVDRAELAAGFRQAALGLAFQSLTYLGVLLAIVFALLQRRQVIHAAEQVEASRRIGFLNRLLLTISEVNELMVREKDRQRLLDETCRIIVEHGGFRMAWVGGVQDDGSVVPIARAGLVQAYLEGIEIRHDDSAAGRGPTGTAIRERRTVAVADIARDPVMARWRDRALERGYRASVAMPLLAGERVLGALMVYSGAIGVFREEALALLERLAKDLAFALDVIESEVRHRETERALSEREELLRQAQKMEAVGRLAGGVAHDFNNLLMAISGYAELALSAKTEELRRERLEEIATAADRAAALTRQLLAFSRKQVLQPRVLNLNGVVADVEKMLRRLLGDNIELVALLDPALDNVRADPGQMVQVLVNLAVNGRDAMPDGGRLTITTRNVTGRTGDVAVTGELEPGSYVELSVTDAGEGIPAGVLEHVFEPFFTTKELGKGTGLGLSTVYGIVKQSGGAITVESQPGAGTTFRVYLPVADGEAEEIPDTPREVAAAGGERVLVVEDNLAVRNFVTRALTDAGYDVVDAASAEEALSLLADGVGPFDLLLTDVVLPKMDGYDLARQAAGTHPALRVLYMTGYTDNPRIREAALHDAIDLIEKPFTSTALAARVREILDRPERV